MDKTNRMKKTYHFIILLFVANFSSCTGNDVVDPSITEGRFIGRMGSF